MSDISAIGSSLGTSLISQLLNPGQAANRQAGSTSSVDADIVSLLGSAGASDNSLYNVLGGTQESDSTGSLYDILLSAENAQIMKNDPALTQALLAAEETQTTAGAASGGSTQAQTTGAQLLQNLQNINLLTVSPDALMSMLQRNIASQSPTAQAATGSQVDQTV
ncbi:MAG: hypothetical protein ABSE25_05780 [Syntrophorhabdales bacterium]|jgi:hypothetical protein